ncbi:MAG: hypothetical protein IPL91_09310 [Hyphomicrobium sp.]|nr:hypothetical protein [Hyphomicrobium sp.]
MHPKAIGLMFALAVAGSATQAAPALAGLAGEQTDRVRLALGTMPVGGGATPAIVVHGANGRYDRVATTSVALPLTLSADLVALGSSYKILKSNVVLKSEGAAASSSIDMLADQGPVQALSRAQVFTFELNPQGPVAQNAVSVCNGLDADERASGSAAVVSMDVAVRWQVTTGRFTFKWTNYDRVALTQEIVSNPDFYADQVTQDAEALIATTVRCEPLAQEIATPVVTPKVERHAALAAVAPANTTPTATPAAIVHQAAARADDDKPTCDGGMLRQISTGAQRYLCLCPGNTTRISTGDNGFMCEKRRGR